MVPPQGRGKKKQRIPGRTRFKDNTMTVPRQQHRKSCWYFLIFSNKSASVRIYYCTFHPRVFKGIVSTRNVYTNLLIGSFKDK
jgi:hypothetical protein